MLAENQDDLFYRYIEVCNEALVRNRDRFPFKQILGAARDQGCGRRVEVVVTDVPMSGRYVIQIEQDRIQARSHDACGSCECDGSWDVSKAYLADVVANPQLYIQNPARLDWDWMYQGPAGH